MKTVIRIILVMTFLQSCSKNNINSDLLGNWKSTKSANIVELNFFKDAINLYNEIRLHLSLGYKTPNMVYKLSA